MLDFLIWLIKLPFVLLFVLLKVAFVLLVKVPLVVLVWLIKVPLVLLGIVLVVVFRGITPSLASIFQLVDTPDICVGRLKQKEFA